MCFGLIAVLAFADLGSMLRTLWTATFTCPSGMDRPVNAAPVVEIARGPGREFAMVIALNCGVRALWLSVGA
jgi:hypothetical protein